MRRRERKDMPTFFDALARLAASDPPVLRNSRDGRLVADFVMTTPDSAARRKGLLGRASMPEGTALIVAPTNAIHTFFMQFAIDVVFVSRNGRVVKTVRDLGPWRIAAALRAAAAIELPAGTLARVHLRRGDVLRVEAFGSAPTLVAGGEAVAG
jgi:uncharacterized membrane protein (UPF0127 family)